jgi:hypothetical protein
VAVHYVCNALDPAGERLYAKEIRGQYVHSLSIRVICPEKLYDSCIEHTIHLMASHFVSALWSSSLRKTKQQIHGADNDDCEVDEYDEEYDIETSMEIEASENDVDAI